MDRRDREWREWQIDRYITVNQLNGIPLQEITAMDIVFCNLDHGRPCLADAAPKTRFDRRFRFPQPRRQLNQET